jgi:hypothetical protein
MRTGIICAVCTTLEWKGTYLSVKVAKGTSELKTTFGTLMRGESRESSTSSSEPINSQEFTESEDNIEFHA